MRVHDTSLRAAAGAIGLTPAGLKQFLRVTLTSPRTAEQLDDWYVRYAEAQDNPVEFDDPKAALDFLVEALPPTKRRDVARQMLRVLARACDTAGEPYPEWLLELQVLYEADRVTEPVGVRRSALGKYAHLSWSSEDYARRKQEEIELEDGRAAASLSLSPQQAFARLRSSADRDRAWYPRRWMR
jgi:hypothetical protein